MVGDVIGRPGRRVLKSCLNQLRAHLDLDFVTVNGENLAGGFGITEKTFREVLSYGVDAVTMGNHWHSKPDVHALRRTQSSLVLPRNLPNIDGLGQLPSFLLPDGKTQVVVLNLMGIFAMKETYDCPFRYIESKKSELLALKNSGSSLLLVDFHGEASSEKQVAWHYLDGIATAMIGTHTHTPTSDERISSKGTALLTDVGMTGPYDSVIGMCKDRALKRFFGEKKSGAHEVADTKAWFCGFLLEIRRSDKKCEFAHRIQWREEEENWRFSSVFLKEDFPKTTPSNT